MELNSPNLLGPEHNLYEMYKEAAGEVEGADLCVKAIEATLKHFRVKKQLWPRVGDIVLRLAHVMGEQDEPVHIAEDADDFVHWVFDLYEHYNRVGERMLRQAHLPVEDGQHQFGL